MKKLFMLSLIFMCLFISSCSVENDKSTLENKIAVQEIKSQKNVVVQRVMYSLLTPEEKQLLWTQKIDVLVSDLKLNYEQIKLLTEVKSHLTVEYFNDSISNDSKEINKVFYMKGFLAEAKILFSAEFIYYNFYTINSSKTALPDEFTRNCACNQSTLWTCGVVSPVTCRIPFYACTVTTSGCGLWWGSSCDGQCR